VLLGAGKKTPWAGILAEVEHASRVGEDDSRAAKCGVEAELSRWVAFLWWGKEGVGGRFDSSPKDPYIRSCCSC
jgi:hypothetical protein